MSTTRFHLHLERCDPARNMARFYALSLERSLFDEVILVRRWGRIGSWGRVRMEGFHDERSALAALLALVRSKRQRGYRIRPCHHKGHAVKS